MSQILLSSSHSSASPVSAHKKLFLLILQSVSNFFVGQNTVKQEIRLRNSEFYLLSMCSYSTFNHVDYIAL